MDVMFCRQIFFAVNISSSIFLTRNIDGKKNKIKKIKNRRQNITTLEIISKTVTPTDV